MDEDRADVRLQIDVGLVEGEGADARRRRGADAGQGDQLFVPVRKRAAVALDNFDGSPVQGEGAPVVSHALPCREHVGVGGPGEGEDRGEASEPVVPARLDARDLGLLEHDLADPDEVGVARASPRQVAPVRGGKVEDARAEGGGVERRPRRARLPHSPRCLRHLHARTFHERRSASRRSVGPGFTA